MPMSVTLLGIVTVTMLVHPEKAYGAICHEPFGMTTCPKASGSIAQAAKLGEIKTEPTILKLKASCHCQSAEKYAMISRRKPHQKPLQKNW
eukprot:m.175254 g.175254  ORF g.175254 m.175254 type:complete len:91 (+) comp31805_c7_seq2:1476-1748(+)